MLFSMGDFMNHNWWLILLMVAAVIISIKMWGRTARGRFQLDWIKLKVPVAGDLMLKMSIARFCRTFGTLINSGVPMMRSLEIVGETLGNVVLTHAIDQVRWRPEKATGCRCR